MTKLDTEILKTLDMLYDKFRIEQSNNRVDDINIAIYDNDLTNYYLDTVTAGDAISVIIKKDERIQFSKLFNEDDYHTDLLNGEYPSIYEIKLPKDFDKTYTKLKNFYNDNSNLKISISISKEEGICKNKQPTPCYPLKGKRMKLIFELRTKAKGQDLADTFYNGSLQLLSKEIGKINTNFTSLLNLEYDLIIHLKTNGYSLNKKEYEIDFLGSI